MALSNELKAVGTDPSEWSEVRSPFCEKLMEGIFIPGQIKEDDLLQYDGQIVQYWQEIVEKRRQDSGEPLTMKYFQYLALLFSEIYLDWFFTRKSDLLEALNRQLSACREKKEKDIELEDYDAYDLNKLAYWSATGSGKTLIMHINLKQYLKYYRESNHDKKPDYLLLLTPNEGLSHQHMEELELSGIDAERFDNSENWRLLRDNVIVLEITKLAEESGDKTVTTRAFEGSRLILIDEGHRGTASAGQWMKRRSELIGGGFAFEYSATFSQSAAQGQTIAKAKSGILQQKSKRRFQKAYNSLNAEEKNQIRLTASESAQIRATSIREIYAKAIIFDYSYKHFYQDGYGKDSVLLNLNREGYEQNRKEYFTACLLTYYQQLWLWEEHRENIEEFNIEKPLWVFVGNTVNREDSDILDVVKLLACFLGDKKKVKDDIDRLINNNLPLINSNGENIFAGKFQPLAAANCEASDIYDDILKRLFNSESKQKLKLINAGKSDGEVLLRVGNGVPFGVINIGDKSKFLKNAKKCTELECQETNDFVSGLFHTINDEDSKINILIGARKFIEGWSSWRVSTMGLLNMGRGEGSQVIQLFGRGVRLKGYDMSLQRSLPNERQGMKYLRFLETLSIFGVRADYISAFKDYIKGEGFDPKEEIIELNFATKSKDLKGQQLRIIKLQDGYGEYESKGFKRIHFPTLCSIPKALKQKIIRPSVMLDLYPVIETLPNDDDREGLPPNERGQGDSRKKGFISPRAMACFDWDKIFLEVQEHKLQRNYSNLRVGQEQIIDFCQGDKTWYTLFIPPHRLQIRTYGDILEQESILIRLLKLYTDRFYRSLKSAYEGSFFESNIVSKGETSMIDSYEFEIDKDDEGREYERRLKQLRKLVAEGNIGEASRWNAKHMVAISFSQHLYYPLMFADEKELPLKMRPMAFDAESEIKFVQKLKEFYEQSEGLGLLKGKSLYLLRNAAKKNKGIGFSLAGSFYPDFLLWLVDDTVGKQWLSFIDPKGIRNMNLTDAKFGLYKEIKKVEKSLKDPGLNLSAFILSITGFAKLLNMQEIKKEDLKDRHILFMEDEDYIEELLRRILFSK